MIIRTAKPEDAKRVAEINVVGWHTAYKDLVPADFLDKWQVTEKRIENFQKAIENTTHIFLVAEEKGQVIGYLHGGKNKKGEGIVPIDHEVYGLYVDPAFQRKGIGRSLLREFKKQIQNQAFFLHAMKGNEKAMAFYTKIGGTRSPEYDMDHTWGDVTCRIEAFLFL